jgi:hypothetical protein
MLDELISNHYKVSNNPALLGWNPTMSIQMNLAQLKKLYRKPNVTILLNNNMLFSTDFSSNNAPEQLFHRIEQCQEVAILADTP